MKRIRTGDRRYLRALAIAIKDAETYEASQIAMGLQVQDFRALEEPTIVFMALQMYFN